MPEIEPVPLDARTTTTGVSRVEPAAAGDEQPGQLRLHRGDHVAHVGAALDQEATR